MHRCAEVTEAVYSFNRKYNESKHQETLPGWVKRDTQHYNQILRYFEDHNSFKIINQLISLNSGLIDVNNSVNCDNAEAVGTIIKCMRKLKPREVIRFATCENT